MQKGSCGRKFSSLILEIVTLIFFFSNYAKDVSRGSEIWGAIMAKCEKIELRTPEEESKNSTVQ